MHRETGLRYVTCDHDFGEITDCEHLPARRALFAQVAGGAHVSLAVASPMADDLARLFPAARALTVHNGADPVPPALHDVPRPAELRDRLVVYAASNFYPRKGFPLLVEAFARVADRHPTAVLRIAGDGLEASAVDAAIARAALGDRIQRLGLQPHDAVQQELVWADVFANVGWDEPFATVVTEALAAGTPVVWAADAGNNDVLEDGVHGRVVEPRDVASAAAALDGLLADGALRERMGAAARELFARRLTWDANAARLLEVLRAAAADEPVA